MHTISINKKEQIKITIMKFKYIFIVLLFLVTTISCNTEDIDDNLFFTVDLIAKDSELFGLIEDVTEDDSGLTCIEFVYSFTVAIYNTDGQEEASQVVSSDQEFYQLLESLEDGYSIGMSFPIVSELEDGTTFEINTPEELQEAIGACKEEWQERVIGECSGILEECVWKVAIPDDLVYSTYIDAVYNVSGDGTVIFYHRGIAYNGNWIVYFIEDELHLNINIDNQQDIGLDWNFDWKINAYISELIELENDLGDRFNLVRECEEENYCTTLTFTECELDDQPSVANFDLPSYKDCIIVMAAPQPEIDDVTGELPLPIEWDLGFYLTQVDAETAVNEINIDTVYTNTINQEELYVRIENPETQEFSLAIITLEAVFCE